MNYKKLICYVSLACSPLMCITIAILHYKHHVITFWEMIGLMVISPIITFLVGVPVSIISLSPIWGSVGFVYLVGLLFEKCEKQP
jgi:uncharacterized membrane protein